MIKAFILGVILLMMTVLFSHQAWPHSLDKVGLSVRYYDNEVQLIANVPVQAFIKLDATQGFNESNEGKVTLKGLNTWHESLLTYAKQNVLFLDDQSIIPVLTSARLVALSSTLKPLSERSNQLEGDAVLSNSLEEKDIAYIKLIFDYAWSNVPQSIDFRYSLLVSNEPIHIQILDQAQKVLKTADISQENNLIRIKSAQTVTDTIKLAGKMQTIWQTGIWHVLKGADHILFILALVLVVRRFKALLLPISAFTLCHSITLAFIAQGFTHNVPSWLIEAAIAASILFILVFEFAGKSIKSLSWITGGLGIIHGMGFAQALTNTLGDLMLWADTLFKLTVAIEMTQLGIASIGLGLIYLANKLIPNYIERSYQACSLMIAVMASFWFYERMLLAF